VNLFAQIEHCLDVLTVKYMKTNIAAANSIVRYRLFSKISARSADQTVAYEYYSVAGPIQVTE